MPNVNEQLSKMYVDHIFGPREGFDHKRIVKLVEYFLLLELYLSIYSFCINNQHPNTKQTSSSLINYTNSFWITFYHCWDILSLFFNKVVYPHSHTLSNHWTSLFSISFLQFALSKMFNSDLNFLIFLKAT